MQAQNGWSNVQIAITRPNCDRIIDKMAVVVGLLQPERLLEGAFERQHSKENVHLISLVATAGPGSAY